ncbi:MAG: hypothetical protein ACOYK9_01165 [Chlamydiia bacterium]
MFKQTLVVFSCCLLFQGNIFGFITNPARTDGFGAQYQTIIYSIIYAELHGEEFRYTPFQDMEHNYDGQEDFLEKKEHFINLIHHFPLNTDPNRQTISLCQFIAFFESHLKECAESAALQKVKRLFRENKRKADYYDENYLNIALHIRRANSQDNRFVPSADSVYLKTIEALRRFYRNKPVRFHIFSQGKLSEFQSIFSGKDVVYHIDTEIEETFASMVFADVLVTGMCTSFSYTAALLSEGKIIYMPFWHPPLPRWFVFNEPLQSEKPAVLKSVLFKYLRNIDCLGLACKI